MSIVRPLPPEAHDRAMTPETLGSSASDERRDARRSSRVSRGPLSRLSRLSRAWRADDGAAVAEFPLVAVLIIVIALGVVQAALIMHTRNTLIDAAVQGAHHAALVGSAPEDGAQRAEQMITDRFGGSLEADAVASQNEVGEIRIQVTATLPLVGLLGPSTGLTVEGRALDEESW